MAVDLEKIELMGAVQRLSTENRRLLSDNAALLTELDRMREIVERDIRERYNAI